MTASETHPRWEPLTAVRRPDHHRLEAALLTTFDPPKPDVLIEDYLPVWLGLENAYAEEGRDRLRYFAELEDELRRLKGRIAMISTPGSSGTSAEGWIWSYIRRLEVGVEERAVQHAKLWMFHWTGSRDGEAQELLEIVISSANLTHDGLYKQLQAGWRCTAALVNTTSSARLASWGVLPAFIEALGGSSGAPGRSAVSPWIELLRRAPAPTDVAFMASVPGNHAASTLRRATTCWGIAGLARRWTARHPRVGIMAPTIGRWDPESLEAWCAAAGVEPARLSLAWIPPAHPWASSWQLDVMSEQALTEAGVTWLRIAGGPGTGAWESPFCDEHRETDRRWSHAKLYELRDGNRRSLLVTSANFSRAAWGRPNDTGLKIENFELGVVLPVRTGFIGYLGELPAPRHTCEIDYSVTEPPIAWIAAEWDGTNISIECRPRHESRLHGTVEVLAARADSADVVSVVWQGVLRCTAQVPWQDAGRIPLMVTVSTEAGASRAIGIADVRPGDSQRYICGEFDEEQLREAADVLIEERYGFVTESDGSGLEGRGASAQASGGAPASYSVLAYEDARRRFAMIDNWAKVLDAENAVGRQWVLSDGKRIAERWHRIASDTSRDPGLRIAARIATEELCKRIRLEA